MQQPVLKKETIITNAPVAVMRKTKLSIIQDTNTALGHLMVHRHTHEPVRTPDVLLKKPKTTILTVGIGRLRHRLCVATAVAVIIAGRNEGTVQPVAITRRISPKLHIQLIVI